MFIYYFVVFSVSFIWIILAKLEDPTIPDVKPLNLTVMGCYKDKGGEFRPFPYVKHQTNYFIYNDWNNIVGQIETCRNFVMSKSFKYFGYQFFGECWYGPPLRVNYAKDGKSKDCVNGGGVNSSVMVYRING